MYELLFTSSLGTEQVIQRCRTKWGAQLLMRRCQRVNPNTRFRVLKVRR